MPTQLYSHHTPVEYRQVTTSGFGAMILNQIDCHISEHDHPEAQISVLFTGSVRELVAHGETGISTRTRLASESLAFVPPGQPHRLNWQGQGSLLNVYISGDRLAELLDQRSASLTPHLSFTSHKGALTIAHLMLEEFRAAGGLTPPFIDHAGNLIAHILLRLRHAQVAGKTQSFLTLARLQPAVDFIHDQPERDCTLTELAYLCHSSVYHFARSFSARVGVAPFVLQRQLRIKKAKELLCNSDLSIEAVGFAVGIANAPYFARVFRSQTGVSPTEYRRACRTARTPGFSP